MDVLGGGEGWAWRNDGSSSRGSDATALSHGEGPHTAAASRSLHAATTAAAAAGSSGLLRDDADDDDFNEDGDGDGLGGVGGDGTGGFALSLDDMLQADDEMWAERDAEAEGLFSL